MLQRVIMTVIALLVCAGPAAAGDLIALVGGRSAKFKDRPGAGADSASVTFASDSGVWSLGVPTCDGSPVGAFVRFSTSGQTNPRVNLPCEKWTASSAGFRYRDREGTQGGIEKVLYKFGKLVIKAKGVAYDPPITGPVTFAEVRFDVGEKNYCGRFTVFRKNDATQVRATRPSEACEVVCGDAITEGGEECDDGNATNGDGCDGNCTVTGCGNGVVSGGEECDDGNATNGDGCDSNCTPTGCGNGIVTGSEECDDGNTAGGDGCRGNCTVELCGDTIIDPGEECDDGNQDDGDCCSSACLLDPLGTPCDDGQFCTNDSCDNGSCAVTHYVPSECNDRNFCTDDECDENLSGGAGACTHTLSTRPCSDGNSCTVGDTCAGGECVPGGFTEPWINEIDYDDQSEGAGTNDNDEFIEIAGPSGMDISNYWLVSVEGGGSGCNTPLFYNVGVVHWTAQIPAGTVLRGGTCVGGEDDGDGCASSDDCPGGICDDPTMIGYYVACFGDTSTDVVECDGQFDRDWSDSTVHNAHVYNTDDSCPDGVVLADQNFQSGSPPVCSRSRPSSTH